MRAVWLGTTCLLCTPALFAQGDASAELGGRLPPQVIPVVAALADSARARGLPSDPLLEKAVEGSSKGVSGERIIGAVRAVFAQLDVARDAARAGGVDAPGADVVEAGAFALNAGLEPADVTALVRRSEPSYAPALVLRVVGTLTALGVPPAVAVRVTHQALDAHTSTADLADLPRQVQLGMARGVSPGDAANGLGHNGPRGASPPPGTQGASVPHGPPPEPPPSSHGGAAHQQP